MAHFTGKIIGSAVNEKERKVHCSDIEATQILKENRIDISK